MKKYAIGSSAPEFDADDLAKVLGAILDLFDQAGYQVDCEITKYRSKSIKAVQ